MKTTLQLWLHQVNRIALFLSLAFGVACAHLPPRELAEPVSVNAGGAVNGIAWAANAADSEILAQVVTGGDKCYGKACKVSSLWFTAAGANAFRLIGTATTFYLDTAAGATVWSCGSGTCNYAYALQTASGQPITAAGNVTATTYLQTIGAATGSLAACNAGTAGGLEYDTATATVKRCNGTAWHTIGEAPHVLAGFMVNKTGAAAGEVVVLDMPTAGTFTGASVTIQTAGTGAGTFTVDAFLTGTGVLSTSATISCTAGVGFNILALTGNWPAGGRVSLRVNTSGCTNQPAATVAATYTSRD